MNVFVLNQCDFSENKDIPIYIQIYELLKNAIIECKLEPDSTLTENEVAKHFNVSRQPVREALIKLAANNFVEVNPKKYTKVKKISKKEVDESITIRSALEKAILKETCKKITDKDIEILEEIIKKQREAFNEGNCINKFLYDDEFHKHIIAISQYEKAWNIILNLKGCLDRVRYLLIGSNVILKEEIVDDHIALLEALKERNAEKAGSIMEEHLEHLREYLYRIMDNCDKNYFID